LAQLIADYKKYKKTDRKTRKMLIRYKMNHSKADVNRLYIEIKEGKRSLLQIEATYRAEIIYIVEYGIQL
jgi:hypothetical protein